jgi:hypothetical protein
MSNMQEKKAKSGDENHMIIKLSNKRKQPGKR